MNRCGRLVGCLVLLQVLAAIPLIAQSFTSDARAVAMGGATSHGNSAVRLARDARSYRSIGVPLGLFQVLKNTNVFDPDDADFNPLHAMELLASPLHYTFNRDEDGHAERLVRDLVNGTVSRDLNAYRGFAPEPHFDSRGLVSPQFGKTFRVRGDISGLFQGVYVGAGPYLALGTDLNLDQRLADLFASTTNVYLPNTTFLIGNTSDGQAAAAFTAGYRARFPLPDSIAGGSNRDGIYVAANYNYLRGFYYESDSIDVRLDTNSNGLVTFVPFTTPLAVERRWSSDGSGFAIDLGTTVVIDKWDLNFSANGIANRINWHDREAERLVLGNLLQGTGFTRTRLPSLSGSERVELPVQYVAGGAYNAERWTATGEVSHGLQDWEFRGGGEYRMSVLEFRAGAHHKKDSWEPASGVGVNITPRIGIDAAIFGSAANIERKRRPALALSLRIMQQN